MPILEGSSRKFVKHSSFETAHSLSTTGSKTGAHSIEINNNGDDNNAEQAPDIEQIRLEIEQMQQHARQNAAMEAVRIEKDAYQKGLEEGEKAGLKNVHDKTMPMIEQISRLIEEVKTFRSRSIEGLQPQVVELAISIAKKVVGQELSTKPEIIVSVVKEALTRIDKAGHVTIKVNPAVYDLFMKHKGSLIDLHPDVGFEVDQAVSAKGALVVGTTEEIITDIDELLHNAIEDMRDSVVIH
ncbi:Flagellar assembly protein FliH/Type III secretion system HrpE domain protein [Candidatus Magnetobacterium bavaricum]|uniref:Flagellar assembly protein FliH n=1 Tax=Candidatus Magnetobacterium bavaricum TaxID=29290 RepID=A0A0F3GSK3_9BACT|nr:Flagellar assembly protein FliH/Type III secretion system HrpE domain protein [Candidatus Magnetobacterium bavaricum]